MFGSGTQNWINPFGILQSISTIDFGYIFKYSILDELLCLNITMHPKKIGYFKQGKIFDFFGHIYTYVKLSRMKTSLYFQMGFLLLNYIWMHWQPPKFLILIINPLFQEDLPVVEFLEDTSSLFCTPTWWMSTKFEKLRNSYGHFPFTMRCFTNQTSSALLEFTEIICINCDPRFTSVRETKRTVLLLSNALWMKIGSTKEVRPPKHLTRPTWSIWSISWKTSCKMQKLLSRKLW